MANTANRNYQKLTGPLNISDDYGTINVTFDAIDADVAALFAALANKSDVGHTHTITQVTGLQTALDGKMSAAASFSLDSLTDVSGAAGAANGFVLVKTGTGYVPVNPNTFTLQASQIQSGTLGVGRGGTGVTTIPALYTALGVQAAIDTAVALRVPITSVAAVALAAGFVADTDGPHLMSAGDFTADFATGNFQLVSNDAAGAINAPVYAGKSGTLIVGVLNTATAGALTLLGQDNSDTGDPFTVTNGAKFLIFYTVLPGITLALVKEVA